MSCDRSQTFEIISNVTVVLSSAARSAQPAVITTAFDAAGTPADRGNCFTVVRSRTERYSNEAALHCHILSTRIRESMV